MTTAQVNIITLISQTHLQRGRYSLSFDVTNKDNTRTTIEKRESEKLVYIEEHCMTGGGCSPEIELHLNNGKCKIKFLVSGALKPSAPLEKGEDVLEYNEAQGECRKFLSLVPTYDVSLGDVATVKFKVGDEVKHTVHIHDVPTERRSDLNLSIASNDSSYLNVSGASQRSMGDSLNSSSSTTDCTVENEGVAGSVREMRDSTTGGGDVDKKLQAKPFFSLGDAVSGLRIGDRQDGGPTGVPALPLQTETASDKVLCDESLGALVGALSPSQASMLLIGLGVPTGIQSQNRENYSKDIVTANFHSLKYWRSKKTSRKELMETSSQQLYEDLIKQLEDIGRKDIASIIKTKMAADKKLEHDDFNKL
ncbi:uncharacterized protein LOC123534358 [Mercenaria mercenaria]|uniref:uncharacterized protein LOC123534358 n=1 Tax=Mercenaria mercenaria TaxID=6596 RepID=UPI00234EDBA2|nr:uncharacterized protein LOC123534358 [Mercenaria mercenaria]XP_053376276.1 uncharacterized protein LOC123534358 [Mercenaria mercenaria]